MVIYFNIADFIDNYKSWQEEERKARRKKTQEIFTPYSIVERMCNKVPEEDWRDPNKTFLEPCCGSGNFILVIIFRRINSGIDWQTTLQTLYALDLLETNVKETRQRVHELLRNISSDYDPDIADLIMDRNFVCHDFFTWNFEEWREMTDEEIRNSKKKIKR